MTTISIVSVSASAIEETVAQRRTWQQKKQVALHFSNGSRSEKRMADAGDVDKKQEDLPDPYYEPEEEEEITDKDLAKRWAEEEKRAGKSRSIDKAGIHVGEFFDAKTSDAQAFRKEVNDCLSNEICRWTEDAAWIIMRSNTAELWSASQIQSTDKPCDNPRCKKPLREPRHIGREVEDKIVGMSCHHKFHFLCLYHVLNSCVYMGFPGQIGCPACHPSVMDSVLDEFPYYSQ